MKIFAFSGWKQSGKDLSADYLVKSHKFVKLSFATVLKDMVAEQYGIPRSHCDLVEFKEFPLSQYPVLPKDKFSQSVCDIMGGEFRKFENGKQLYWTPRALCILEGSIKRSVNSGYWVQRVISQIKSQQQSTSLPDRFTISDLRYRSEVEQLREAFKDDLVVVRIDRWDINPSIDASETDLDSYNFRYIINNCDTKEGLYNGIEEILGER